mmetsp:Transcript_6332/g.15007  ORF Transcript_6332/g.15007 Transcript_6332/m.15007 type:complete len:222 (-) Transcript_6332:384-1049(-)
MRRATMARRSRPPHPGEASSAAAAPPGASASTRDVPAPPSGFGAAARRARSRRRCLPQSAFVAWNSFRSSTFANGRCGYPWGDLRRWAGARSDFAAGGLLNSRTKGARKKKPGKMQRKTIGSNHSTPPRWNGARSPPHRRSDACPQHLCTKCRQSPMKATSNAVLEFHTPIGASRPSSDIRGFSLYALLYTRIASCSNSCLFRFSASLSSGSLLYLWDMLW